MMISKNYIVAGTGNPPVVTIQKVNNSVMSFDLCKLIFSAITQDICSSHGRNYATMQKSEDPTDTAAECVVFCRRLHDDQFFKIWSTNGLQFAQQGGPHSSVCNIILHKILKTQNLLKKVPFFAPNICALLILSPPSLKCPSPPLNEEFVDRILIKD